MFALKITASNGLYSGTTEVYETAESLLKFSRELIAFPNGRDNLLYERGIGDGYVVFSMNFLRVSDPGHVAVDINIKENVENQFRHQEKNKVRLEINVAHYAIDNFQKELTRLATKQEGTAILYAK